MPPDPPYGWFTEAEEWIAAAPKNDAGKVELDQVIAEGISRGYCICPKPLRQMINFDSLTCAWCQLTETRDSWRFWYEYRPQAGTIKPEVIR